MAREKKLDVAVMSLRYPNSVKEKLKIFAKKQRRTLTDQIIYILEEWLQQQKPR